MQLLVVGWDPVRRTHDLWGQEAVLVDGRIIGLLWLERGAFSMGALDEILLQLDLWADAILAVNARPLASEG